MMTMTRKEREGMEGGRRGVGLLALAWGMTRGRARSTMALKAGSMAICQTMVGSLLLETTVSCYTLSPTFPRWQSC